MAKIPYLLECKNHTELINGQYVTIVYVDSYVFLGHYILAAKRIELSAYLVRFPLLHNFVFEHEKQHVKANILQDLWLDVHSAVTLQTDPLLHKQFKDFQAIGLPKKHDIGARLHLICYEFFKPLAVMFVGVPWICCKWLKKITLILWPWLLKVWRFINGKIQEVDH